AYPADRPGPIVRAVHRGWRDRLLRLLLRRAGARTSYGGEINGSAPVEHYPVRADCRPVGPAVHSLLEQERHQALGQPGRIRLLSDLAAPGLALRQEYRGLPDGGAGGLDSQPGSEVP